jgi:outer membrane receptor protein involved in Fe transport
VSYAFPEAKSGKLALLSGVSLQAGVRNVFDKKPPLDAAYLYEFFVMSPYGDIRLRSFWLSIDKSF